MQATKAKHYPISSEPEAAEDWIRCAGCGRDLSGGMCPDMEIADCCCPLYEVEQGIHWDVCALLPENQ